MLWKYTYIPKVMETQCTLYLHVYLHFVIRGCAWIPKSGLFFITWGNIFLAFNSLTVSLTATEQISF